VSEVRASSLHSLQVAWGLRVVDGDRGYAPSGYRRMFSRLAVLGRKGWATPLEIALPTCASERAVSDASPMKSPRGRLAPAPLRGHGSSPARGRRPVA
jgi:hypothetical protein